MVGLCWRRRGHRFNTDIDSIGDDIELGFLFWGLRGTAIKIILAIFASAFAHVPFLLLTLALVPMILKPNFYLKTSSMNNQFCKSGTQNQLMIVCFFCFQNCTQLKCSLSNVVTQKIIEPIKSLRLNRSSKYFFEFDQYSTVHPPRLWYETYLSGF